jgi:four helix bundle protein
MSSPVSSYRQLEVWKLGMATAAKVYQLTERFPRGERFGLTAQIRRAVASVPANVAEGNVRSTRRDYASFVSIARGSAVEATTFILLAVDLGFVKGEDASESLALLDRLDRMLYSLRRRLLEPRKRESGSGESGMGE